MTHTNVINTGNYTKTIYATLRQAQDDSKINLPHHAELIEGLSFKTYTNYKKIRVIRVP